MFDDLQKLTLLDDDVEFLPLVSIEETAQEEEADFGDELPILPLRNTVLFPGVVIPITVGRDRSIRAIKAAQKANKYIGVTTQINPNVEEPIGEDLNQMGTVARIVKTLKMPDGSSTVILHGRDRFVIGEVLTLEPYIKSKFSITRSETVELDPEFRAMISSMKDQAAQIIKLSPNIPTEASIILKNIDNPEFLVHFISSNLNIKLKEKQELLEIHNVKERAHQVLIYLNTELQMLELKDKIQAKVRVDIEKQQRDYFLHQQLKTIQEELGDGTPDGELAKYQARAASKMWSKDVKATFQKEFKKLKRLNPAVPEYSLSVNYIELLLDLPWNDFTEDKFDLKYAESVLDKDHYGLEKVKNRILEYLAVLKLKGDMKSPILCFVGPPGVGKTSLGKSISTSLGRKHIRMSLGGLHDESEIRGHRRTYIGAMPGRIIQSIRKVKTSNPVFILDEIDKISSNFRGDPASALLEVLDPEQNNSFHDNYLEAEYDLSKVMFIATANSLVNMHPALRDRMEIIQISGYSLEEKVEIAKRHLLSKQMKAHGLRHKDVKIGAPVLRKLIDEQTRESGVRELDRKLAAVMRSRAKSVALEEEFEVRIKEEDIDTILGPSVYEKDRYKNDNPPGVSVGLAWTQSGGDILFIETSLSEGKGKLTLTGNLGDVMKESATTVISYLQAHAKDFGIDPDRFSTTNIHVHVPEGGIPKDGPSAGVTILTALVSAFTGKKVRPFLAMTGEITLRGKVLPVGGIKEKVLAAKRAGLNEVLLCELNRKDIDEIKPEYISKLKIHFVKEMKEVIDYAILD